MKCHFTDVNFDEQCIVTYVDSVTKNINDIFMYNSGNNNNIPGLIFVKKEFIEK